MRDFSSRDPLIMQSASGNRVVLDVVTGNPWPKPRSTIEILLSKLHSIKASFQNLPDKYGGSFLMPETYIATLGLGIALSVAGKSTGILLNFCSPSYAESLIEEYSMKTKNSSSQQTDFACYLKVFYGRDKKSTNRLIAEEFVRYDSIRQYHEMFAKGGVSMDISEDRSALESDASEIPISERMLEISPLNPSVDQLKQYVERFRYAGVTLPVLYPYFSF